MKRKNMARNALFTSVLSLLLCVSMLVGTTFAWFTDEVVSGNNVIAAGNLDVELYNGLDTSAPQVTTETDLFEEITYWEPGVVAYENLTVANLGTLALNYQLSVNFENATKTPAGKTLADVLKVGFVEGGIESTTREGALDEVSSWQDMKSFVQSGGLLKGEDDVYGIVIYWEPGSNDNDYNMNNENQGKVLSIDLGIKLLATQKTYEKDSYGPDYDVLAQGATVIADAPTNGEPIDLKADDGNGNPVTVASFTIPASRIADPDEKVKIEIIPTTLDETLTIADDEQASTYEIKVSNLNDEDDLIWVEMQIGTGRTGVKVYHKNVEITDPKPIYNPNTGRVTFQTSSFSPYTVVYDADPVVEEEGGEGDQPSGPNAPADLPKATVTPYTDTKNIEWENYGQWSPTEGLEANLEAAYTFTAQDTQEEAEKSPYANWYCDFYVKLDKDLGKDEIFLGGNYGSFGWVGFHNGDVTLAAGEEIPLLGSVTKNPWTYTQIVGLVREFICGVGDVNDALAGATFTVSLRLTNPEDETEFYDVETINYTFPETTTVTTAGELANALAAGGEVKLGADIVLAETITIPADATTVLDLNGKTVSYNSSVMGEAMITNKGNLTINDTVGKGVINYNYTGEADSTYGKGNYTISNAGTLTVNGGTITIANLSNHAKYPIDNNSTTGNAILVINDGHLYNYNTSAIRQFCNSTTYQNSVTINGGLIEGYCAIWMQNPGKNAVNVSLEITGGEIKSTAKAYVNGTAALKDVSSAIYCTINGTGGAWSEGSSISISGGIFNENVNLAENAPAVTECNATFNGYCEVSNT